MQIAVLGCFLTNINRYCVLQGAMGRPGHPGPAGSKGEKVFLLFSFDKDLCRFCDPFTMLWVWGFFVWLFFFFF